MNTSLRVVLSTRGSHGDIVPFLSVAKHLQAMGHRPVLATCRSFAALAAQHGVPFAPVAPHLDEICRDLCLSPEQVAARSMDPWRSGRFIREHTIQPYFDRIFHDLQAVCEGADVIMANPMTAPWAALVAESQGITWYTLAVNCAPLLVRSAQEPPVLPGFPLKPLVRLLGPRLYRSLIKRAAEGSRRPLRFLDDKARELGLYDRAQHPILDRTFSAAGVMALVPPQFVGRRVPDDLGLPELKFLGFNWFDPAAGKPLDERLRQFLDAGPPPLLFTLGTSVICQAPDVYARWSTICARIGQRAVFIGPADSLGDKVPDGQIVLPWVSLPAVLPRCQAVINAGGVGVCAQVLAAGIPQLVVPFAYDQPDNAMRLRRMGAALVLKPAKARGELMANALLRLCEDEVLRARARALVAQLNPVCGTLAAATVIHERHAATREMAFVA